MGIAEQHEVSAAEEACHDGKLIGRVVLHLVDHDVARIGVAKAGDGHVQVQPCADGQVLHAEQTHADAVDAQPLIALDGQHRA